MMTWYEGRVFDGRCDVTRARTDGLTDLPMRLDLWRHSPAGFEWGYNGSGPAQLALAMLADATGDDVFAVRWHQAFKSEVVAYLPKGKPWFCGSDYVNGWAEKARKRQQPADVPVPAV